MPSLPTSRLSHLVMHSRKFLITLHSAAGKCSLGQTILSPFWRDCMIVPWDALWHPVVTGAGHEA